MRPSSRRRIELEGNAAMAKKSRTTFKKRQKEMARQQRRRDKESRRQERKEEKATEIAPPAPEGEDPHIAGIRPGPQPLPEEWNYVPGRPSRDRPPEDEP